ncbi:MAG: hypothetical protein ACPG4T_22090 [Nannocystaceae bacterium]
MARKYRIEVLGRRGWTPLMGLQDLPRTYCSGYLAAVQEGPTPRLAHRIVRDDGKVMEELGAVEHVGVGACAGFPSAEQYEQAAKVALQRACDIRARENRGDFWASTARVKAEVDKWPMWKKVAADSAFPDKRPPNPPTINSETY